MICRRPRCWEISFPGQREFVTDIRLFRGKRRKMTVNGVPAKNSAALSDVLHTVFLRRRICF